MSTSTRRSTKNHTPFAFRFSANLAFQIIITCIVFFAFIGFLFLLPKVNLFIAVNSIDNFDYVISYLSKNDPKKAINYAERVTRRFPENPYYQLRTGLLLKSAGQPAQARPYLQKAVELYFFPYAKYPDLLSDFTRRCLVLAYVNYGELTLDIERMEESLLYFTYAVDIARESYPRILQIIKRFGKEHNLTREARIKLAKFYIEVADLKRAKNELAKVNIDSPQRDFYFLRGKLHFLEGEREIARKDFSTELEFFPDNLAALIYEDSLTSPLYELKAKILKHRFVPLLDTTKPTKSKYVRILKDMITLNRADSSIKFTLKFAAPMKRRCYIIARGTSALGIFPILKVVENGNKTHLIYINRSTWGAYPIDLAFNSGINTLEFELINDGWVYLGNKLEQGDKLIEDRNILLNNLWYYEEGATTGTLTGIDDLSFPSRISFQVCEQRKR